MKMRVQRRVRSLLSFYYDYVGFVVIFEFSLICMYYVPHYYTVLTSWRYVKKHHWIPEEKVGF